MSRLLSRIGIGAATVETRLPEGPFTPGETVQADIEIEGGRTEQRIDELYLTLLTQCGGEERVVATFETADATTVPAGETLPISTELAIPTWTPITRNDCQVWLKTGLDISWALDPSDEDALEIVSGSTVEGLLAAVEALGFESRGSELREPAWLEEGPFLQAFSFTPTSDAYSGTVDELTLVCQPREADLKTVIEIDKRVAAEEYTEVKYDEQEVVRIFKTADVDRLRRQLESIIDQYTE